MLPFSVSLRAGEPLGDQIVYAVTRAVVSGQLRPGARFPSVRTLSQELRVNPNTAQRVVAMLVERGVLQVQPGVGTIVAGPVAGARRSRTGMTAQAVEPLVVEARRLGVTLTELLDLIREQWRRMDGG